ncbi:hypothetical protein GUJ93_ZPchr0010g7644 [Zizania palustris]|uniref:Uncharacterized protein n=1 Tax=Zizania palustris TaxID=103762 RepID=A0A8J5W174_ZIZPA|nr:hypothetical protein GUJ93_ZPchr0010g7644 [Zizania palustris]
MANHGNAYRDYFSPDASSSAAFTASAAVPNDNQSQSFVLVGRDLSAGRAQMQDLDLNSQGEGLHYLDEYSCFLQRERGRSEQELPSLGPNGDGSRFGAFQPPRQRGRGGSGRGRSHDGRGHHNRLVPNHVVRGAMSSGMNASPIEDVGTQDDLNDEDELGMQKRAECKKFKLGIPAYIEFLHEMFHGVAVDGRTSCIAGDGNEDDLANEEEDGTQNSPLSSTSRKRGSSTVDTATSPSKKNKSPLFKVFKGLIDTLQATNNSEANTLVQLNMKKEELRRKAREEEVEQKRKEREQEDHDIEQCLTMAIECGATEDTDEYYMATQLFEKPYNRTVFCKFKTNEGRLGWLKRCYLNMNRNG